MTEPDFAVVSASVPFRTVPSTEAMIAALHAPADHPGLAPHLERLMLELAPQTALGFCYRHAIPMSVLRAAYAAVSASASLRNPALEDALDGVA